MLQNNLFNINLDALAEQLTPVNLRKPVHLAFIKWILWPFKQQLKTLQSHRAENIYKLNHDARVGRIEKVLNDGFDKVARRIRIRAGNRINPLYIYTPQESKPVGLPQWINTLEEIAINTADFEILIPIAMGLTQPDLNRLSHLTAFYADKDKTFTIIMI